MVSSTSTPSDLHYTLRCVESGAAVEERYTLSCPDHPKSLLRADYAARQIDPRDIGNVFRFMDWLPVGDVLPGRARPVVFRNEDLSREIGVDDLWIAFTGYYPERGAYAASASFKELEALPTYSRLRRFTDSSVVVASAGNTARAFAEVGNQIGAGNVVVVPKTASGRLSVTDDNGMTTLIAVDGDYSDAIAVSDRIVALGGYVPEGGARNVARRDGMGTVVLEAALTSGRLPDRYFQAVGSGTGGIAAWEASMRLIGDGRFGDRLPRLELAQNEPFTPMAKAWSAGRREIIDSDLGWGKRDEEQVYADVLTNRHPPYSLAGGVYDAMSATGGSFRTVSNVDARNAERLWMTYEDVRPNPAASVALASLVSAARSGTIGKDERILLNMTGGGLERAREELGTTTIPVAAEVPADADDDSLREALYARGGGHRAAARCRGGPGGQSAVRPEQGVH